MTTEKVAFDRTNPSGAFIAPKEVQSLAECHEQLRREMTEDQRRLSDEVLRIIRATEELSEIVVAVEKLPIGQYAIYQGKAIFRTGDLKVEEASIYVNRLEKAAITLMQKLTQANAALTEALKPPKPKRGKKNARRKARKSKKGAR